MTFLLRSPASAQDIAFETTCLLKTGIGGVPPGASLDCSAFGVDHEITPATDGINSSDVDTTAFSRLDRTGPGSFTMSAHGSAVSRVLSFPDPARTASAELTGPPFVNNFLMNIRGTPGTRYLLRNTLSVAVAASGPGAGATAGVSTSGCGSVFATTSQALSSTTASQCVRTADGGGLVAQVRSSLIANVELRGQVRDASYAQSIAFSVSPEGPVLLALSAPTQAPAGSPFPQDVRVKASLNTTGAAVAGKLVEFRLKDSAGTVLETLARTTLADGTASANFTVGGGGEFAVEAFCAECVEGARTVTFPITVLSGELTALPGPREGPVGGTLELAFKATEKVLVGGVTEERPIAGTPVSFTVTGPVGDASLSPNPAITEADGVARTAMTLGSVAGAYQVTATCAACKASPVVDIPISALEKRAGLSKVPGEEGGDGQRDLFGVRFSTPLRVSVTDERGLGEVETVVFSCSYEPVASGFRTAAAAPAGASSLACDDALSVRSTHSSPDGKAETILTPAAPGTYRINATCPDCLVGHDEAVFLAKADLKPPKAREGDRGADAGAPEPGACSAKLVQIAPGPDGQETRRPPAPLLICSNSTVLLTCRVTPLVERNTCASWGITPANANVRAAAIGDVTGELTVVNGAVGNFTVQANAVVGGCQARRDIHIGFARLKVVERSPEALQGLRKGEAAAFTAKFEALENIPLALLGEFVEVLVFDDNGGPSVAFEVLQETKKASNGSLSFEVKAVKGASETDEFFGTVVARACGSEERADVLLRPEVILPP